MTGRAEFEPSAEPSEHRVEPSEHSIERAVESAYRQHWARLLAILIGRSRRIDLAEDALAHAYESALVHWARGAVPDNPAAWLLRTASNRVTDQLRRESTLARKLPLLGVDLDAQTATPGRDDAIPDERLRLIFICAHPVLRPPARVALTLRLVAGLRTPEGARAFLVSEPTMAARLTRAKARIAASGAAYRVPPAAELQQRLPDVLAVLYLVFTEGYAACTTDGPVRADLAEEAIRLTRLLADLMGPDPEVVSLLALMLFAHSRRDARTDAAGDLVLLPDQDRGAWHGPEVASAFGLLEEAARLRGATALGGYELQARIQAEHALATSADHTRWGVIAELYAELEGLTGSPVVRLNRAVAVAERDGPEHGLRLLDGLERILAGNHLLHATRADLLRRLGRLVAALADYERAAQLSRTWADRALMRRRCAELRAALTA